MTMSWRLWKSSRWPKKCSVKSLGLQSPEKALSPRTAGGGSARDGAWLHGSRKWLSGNNDIFQGMGGWIKDMKYVHLVPNDDTAPVNIGWGFLSHIPHAPQLVQTCFVNESSLMKGVKRNLCHDPPAEISLRASWLESAPVHSRLILGKALYVMISRCLLCLYIFTQPMPVCHHSQLGSLQQYQCNWKRP